MSAILHARSVENDGTLGPVETLKTACEGTATTHSNLPEPYRNPLNATAR